MKYFLWSIFLLFIAGIVYFTFVKKPKKPEKKKKYFVRKKSGKLRW